MPRIRVHWRSTINSAFHGSAYCAAWLTATAAGPTLLWCSARWLRVHLNHRSPFPFSRAARYFGRPIVCVFAAALNPLGNYLATRNENQFLTIADSGIFKAALPQAVE